MAIDLGDIPSGTPPTAGEKLQIRSAIGVGQTDAPTFLAQTLAGQSLTGTQATSLVDLATTWNTLGTPTALKLNVANTLSNAASNLMDLQVGGVSKFTVNKSGELSMNSLDPATKIAYANAGFQFFGSGGVGFYLGQDGSGNGNAVMSSTGYIGFSSVATPSSSNSDIRLARDAPGILAQRNGTNAQAFRVYNTFPGTTANEWFEIDWKSTANTVQVGTNRGVAGTRRAMNFTIDGINQVFGLSKDGGGSGAWWSIATTGHILCNVDNAYDIGASGANRPRNVYAGTSFLLPFNGSFLIESRLNLSCPTNGRLLLANSTATDFDRFQLGGTTDVFPSIARDGAGIKITGAGTGSTSWIKVPAVVVSALPSAATAGVGARSFVNDALTPVFGNAVAGSGLSKVPVYSDGTNWNVG